MLKNNRSRAITVKDKVRFVQLLDLLKSHAMIFCLYKSGSLKWPTFLTTIGYRLHDFEIFPTTIGYKLHDVATIFRVVNRSSISDYSYVATCRYIPKNFQATTTIQTTCSQCSHVATWSDYMTL